MENYYELESLPKYEPKAPEDVQHDAQVLIDSFIQPAETPAEGRTPGPGLPQPFCLPQIGTGFDTPFARGYNDILQQNGIPMNTFLDFVDGLNMAMISNPPLQVVNVAGAIIGFLPHWWFMVAGTVMQTGAQVGMHVLSKTLSDRYLRAANERIFAPHGLRVRLIKTPALRALVGHPEADKPAPSKLKQFGQTAGDVVLRLPLPLPFVKRGIRALMDKPPPIDPRMTDPLARRLMVMQGFILPVAHGPAIPPPVKPDGVLDKMNGYVVGKRQTKVDKQARDAAVRREILAGMPISREGGMTRRDYKMARRASRGRTRRLKTKVEEDARREHRNNERLVWLVILNEADDAKISGTEAMDNSSDNITLNDRELEETRERFVEEEDSSDSEDELEDYDPKSQASGSKSKADAI
ncbi:hypothetical protein SCHPADRAFT_861819 [Schizopora paradoxa]|uniref:Uncharacterized protein n=1 Tax=Schizopora paradoxa TaxID=27342 RepID=A0A0H2R2E4_9AGAM|nr:hypothetical protein SCHPADRAFT_861819 [Schizopora paradoxa]